jgi:hypothetical protein
VWWLASAQDLHPVEDRVSTLYVEKSHVDRDRQCRRPRQPRTHRPGARGTRSHHIMSSPDRAGVHTGGSSLADFADSLLAAWWGRTYRPKPLLGVRTA